MALDPSMLAALEELDQSQSGVMAHLIRLFLHEAPAQLAALQEAVAQGDALRVEEMAHRLKGSAAQFGAMRMSRTCAALQETGHRADLGRAAAQMADLEREFVRVRTALESMLQEASTV